MRVVHLSTLHQPLDVRIFHKECRALAHAGREVHFIVGNAPDGQVEGVRFHRFEAPATRFRPGRIGRRLARMYRQALALRANVYHFHDPELIPVGLLLKQAGAKVVYDVHEDAPREAYCLNRDAPWEGRWKACAWTVLESLALRTLDGFVCATPTIARRFHSPRTVVVRNFPRLAEFEGEPRVGAIPYTQRPPNLAYVGSISAVRGIRELLQAVAALPASTECRLILSGAFFPATLQAEVERLPGWGRVEFRGWQSREAIGNLLAHVRIGLVLLQSDPAHAEALPVKLFEYMAAGLPVIASDFPLWRKLIGRIGCGLCVDPSDTAAVARAIQSLLDRPVEAEAMGRRGLAAVRSEINWENEAPRLLDLYRRLECA